jgi:hypothetical protein
MLHPLTYQLYGSEHEYRYEHRISAATQRAADVRIGEAAAGLRDLRLCLGRAFRLEHRLRSARRAGNAMTASVRVLSSVR